MTREETLKSLRDLFLGYIETKRRLAEDVSGLLVKGWPDRKRDVQAWAELTTAVIECEILRFEHLLIHAPLESPIHIVGGHYTKTAHGLAGG